MKILLTGFEPFGEKDINPSQMVVDAISGQKYSETELVKALLPVHHNLGPKTLNTLLKEQEPDAVIAFGLATGRPKISLERLAINWMDYRIADNAGIKINNQPIFMDAPAAYFATLPIESMHEALNKENIPGEISLSAGTYLCNQVFFTLMHEISVQNLRIKAGFIHLPALPEQAANSEKVIPSMSLDMEIMAAQIMITQLIQSLQE